MKTLIIFKEESSVIRLLDEACKGLGVSRSDYLRVILRSALIEKAENPRVPETQDSWPLLEKPKQEKP